MTEAEFKSLERGDIITHTSRGICGGDPLIVDANYGNTVIAVTKRKTK